MTRALPVGSVSHLILSVACGTPMTALELLDRAEERYGLIDNPIDSIRMAVYSMTRHGLLRVDERRVAAHGGQATPLVVLTPEGEAMLDRLDERLRAWKQQRAA